MLVDMDLPFVEQKIVDGFVRKTEGTYIGDLLKGSHLV